MTTPIACSPSNASCPELLPDETLQSVPEDIPEPATAQNCFETEHGSTCLPSTPPAEGEDASAPARPILDKAVAAACIDAGFSYSWPALAAPFVLRLSTSTESSVAANKAYMQAQVAMGVVGAGIFYAGCTAGIDELEANRAKGQPLPTSPWPDHPEYENAMLAGNVTLGAAVAGKFGYDYCPWPSTPAKALCAVGAGVVGGVLGLREAIMIEDSMQK